MRPPLGRLALALVIASITLVMALSFRGQERTPVVEAATNKTLLGFRANEGGSGALNLGYTGGNLGNTWGEGEWVPYQFSLTKVQDDFPNLNGLVIEISYDFFASQGQQNARFIDLVRGLQVNDQTQLVDTHGWPQASGSPYPMTTRAQVETAQNSSGENVWTGFSLLNLPNSQVNRRLTSLGGGVGTPTDARRVFRILPADLIAAGIPTNADNITIY